jgi:hypothetical protein
MSRPSVFLFALIATLLPHATSAVCSKNEPGYLWNYVGDLSKDLRIKMTLVFSGSELKGRYVYASQLKDIELKGRIREGREVILDELDTAGQVTGQFIGQFVEKDPRGIYGDSRLECDVMVGTWQKRGSPQKRPFYLHAVDATTGSLSQRYAAAGASDSHLVEENARRFWEGVKRGDKTSVAQQIRYPIKVTMGKRLTTLRSAADFEKHYDTLITHRTREAILDDIPRYMFVREEGVMLANGIVWFGPDGKVITLIPLP